MTLRCVSLLSVSSVTKDEHSRARIKQERRRSRAMHQAEGNGYWAMNGNEVLQPGEARAVTGIWVPRPKFTIFAMLGWRVEAVVALEKKKETKEREREKKGEDGKKTTLGRCSANQEFMCRVRFTLEQSI